MGDFDYSLGRARVRRVLCRRWKSTRVIIFALPRAHAAGLTNHVRCGLRMWPFACKQGTGVLGCASCAAGDSLAGRRLEMPLKIATKQVDGVTVVHCNGRIVFGE